MGILKCPECGHIDGEEEFDIDDVECSECGKVGTELEFGQCENGEWVCEDCSGTA